MALLRYFAESNVCGSIRLEDVLLRSLIWISLVHPNLKAFWNHHPHRKLQLQPELLELQNN